MNHRNGPPVDLGCARGVMIVFAIYAVTAVVIMIAAWVANTLAATLHTMGLIR